MNRGWKTACLIVALWAATGIASQAQTFTNLATFDITNGAYPYGVLVQGLDGDFYGTTRQGGRQLCIGGCGTVFKVTPGGTLTTTHDFVATDGYYPEAGLVLGMNGNFYGATEYDSQCESTFFEITPGGALTTLYQDCTDDQRYITSSLVQDTVDGNFYGTTLTGATNLVSSTVAGCSDYYGDGCGTVFKITPSGTLTMLHSFCNFKGCPDGALPTAPLVQAGNGLLFGTTTSGGGDYCGLGTCGPGTVFEIGTEGSFKVVHEFLTTDIDVDPVAGLVLGSDGDFYGTSELGGHSSWGTIYKITATGTVTTLHSFDLADGASPTGTLIQATDGNFYGTTMKGGPFSCLAGGENGCGTIFEITPDGTFTTLHSFDGTDDGQFPYAGLVQGTDGDLYGTTHGFIGSHRFGTVFRLSLGLPPFVRTLPTAAYPGKKIFILGTGLTGATAVKFGDKAAEFTVVSATEIIATVPKDPCMVMVQVVTPSGILSSNIPFRVF
ncbi:MAG: choice-of-anchor tandem repeat GloVer-containing protein [Candidatus Sulfotelmatobacter sp.]